MTDNTEKTRAARAEMDEKTEGLLFGLALTHLFSDAFGVKFGKEERAAYLKARQEHEESFPLYTEWFYKDGCEQTIYLQQLNIFKAYLNLPEDVPPGRYIIKELKIMNAGDIVYDALRRRGIDHHAVLALIDGLC